MENAGKVCWLDVLDFRSLIKNLVLLLSYLVVSVLVYPVLILCCVFVDFYSSSSKLTHLLLSLTIDVWKITSFILQRYRIDSYAPQQWA